MRILITDQNFGDDARIERELAEANRVDLSVADCRDEDDVVDALVEHRPDALLVQFAPIGRRTLEHADAPRAVVRAGIGIDNVDVAAASELGVAVARIPDYCVDEVADHTLTLVLAVERGLLALAGDVAGGGWSWGAAAPVRRLRGRTFALLGFGQIARAVAVRAAAFGFAVAAHDPALAEGEIAAAGVDPRAFDELLRGADVLSVHVPLTEATRGLVGRDELALLPDGALVVNTARGGIVDEAALAEAAATGRIRAALDVLAVEPPPPDHPLRHAVSGVLLTPHAAWYSEEAVVDLRHKSIHAAITLLHGGRPAGLVTA